MQCHSSIDTRVVASREVKTGVVRDKMCVCNKFVTFVSVFPVGCINILVQYVNTLVECINILVQLMFCGSTFELQPIG